MIYLDYCATTPMRDEALETYVQACRSFSGNEQSLHDYGEEAKQLLHYCREEIAALIGGHPHGVYFTNGGSDSNITALLSLAYGNSARGRHIITSPFEHPSVYQALGKLQEEGFTVEEAAAKPNGEVCLESIASLIREDTILITVCHASSETGVIQPLAEIGKLASDAVFHTDAVQTFAKVPLDVTALRLDAISMSAHKIYGPKNTGACYIAPHVRWKSIYPGVSHQDGFKPGTVDVPGIAAFTTAARVMHDQLEANRDRWQNMQRSFLQQVDEETFTLFGDPVKRLPHHLALGARGYEGQWMLLECNRRGIAISSGSACQSSLSAPPKSLLAMGYTPEDAHSLFRISFGIHTTDEHLEKTAAALQEITARSQTNV
ncbi:IscS subfamily cysteine desulfurase [Bacillus piscicola]|uniref:IscS subfamily cysteine desulfurase n=1 Tax=Bacillus piscicola TaxID=1632684 RepID=UPI001F09D5EA|nr:IscS subfamily cysteine desulfurase [Bacillus piscicola]